MTDATPPADRTRAYLRGRFGDYYRTAPVDPPPEPAEREWGFVPWSGGMVRHRSLLDLGALGDFLERERPRHVYHSAARYDDPGASRMGDKGRRGADLVFDLDADHLPAVDPDADAYADMLAACKDALRRLLDLLETDFGFDDLTVVFSGGRGYHVHVRDPGVAALDSSARRGIVDYVRGAGLDAETVIRTRAAGGVTRRVIDTDGGWGRRVHAALRSLADDLRAADDADAIERLRAFDGIGERRAEALLRTIRDHPEAVEAGNVEAGGPGIRRLVDALTDRVARESGAPIDEPVTTDTSRLIRLPGSLHGGSGLVVRRLGRDEIDGFDPLTDAVPEPFRGNEIAVEVTERASGTFDGDSYRVTPGELTVPEPLGVFLMARGQAEKGRE
jgi:DNA primase small subunit